MRAVLLVLFVLVGLPGFLYLIFAIVWWLRRDHQTRADRPAFMLGLLFSAVFVLALPTFLSRYGWVRCVILFGGCIAGSVVVASALDFLLRVGDTNIGNVGAAAFFLMLPIRALGGLFVLSRDAAWRRSPAVERREESAIVRR